jgi:hypothetical protein
MTRHRQHNSIDFNKKHMTKNKTQQINSPYISQPYLKFEDHQGFS